MKFQVVPLSVLMVALAACTVDKSPQPQRIALSYPYALDDGVAFDGYRQIAERVSGAYVRVVIYGHSEDEGTLKNPIVSGASGTIVDPRGYLVTAAHIARHPRFRARITTMDGRTHDGVILHVAPTRELALLKIEPFPDMQVASIGDSRRLLPAQQVISIGTPSNRMGVVSPGRIAVPKHRKRIELNEFGFDDAIELEMEVEPGHSGGPLFDKTGRLVGIVVGFGLGDTSRVPYVSSRIAYAVPSTSIINYLSGRLTPEDGTWHLKPASTAFDNLQKHLGSRSPDAPPCCAPALPNLWE